jgi:hypothetical protein
MWIVALIIIELTEIPAMLLTVNNDDYSPLPFDDWFYDVPAY